MQIVHFSQQMSASPFSGGFRAALVRVLITGIAVFLAVATVPGVFGYVGVDLILGPVATEGDRAVSAFGRTERSNTPRRDRGWFSQISLAKSGTGPVYFGCPRGCTRGLGKRLTRRTAR